LTEARPARGWRRPRVFLAAAALAILGGGGLFAYAASSLPNINDIGRATGTIRFLDRRGNLISQVGYNQTPLSPVPLDRVAPLMRQAIIAAEDRNFYQEGSFDIKGMARAVVVDLVLRRPAQGGSTITEQLAKLTFLSPRKTVVRKLQEDIIAAQLASRYSKDKILETYLNHVYFGEGAYGVDEAAQVYFGKHASQLDLREASLLAGLVDAPSYNDPYRNPDAAFARQHYVLRGMVGQGDITETQAGAVDPLAQPANQDAVVADLKHGKPLAVGPAPHFVQYVTAELQQLFSNEPATLNGNLTVTTTLDLATQAKAMKVVRDGVARVARQGANNGALLMIDANTGEIRAMVGSADYNDESIGGQYNIVTARRRPGSSFKPYVYGEAFTEHKLTPNSTLNDTATESQRLGGVKDFDGSFYGVMSVTRALVLSRNIPAEQAMAIAGVSPVIDFAHSLGIRSPLSPNVSTAIGSSPLRMIDHAAGYAAFANGGHRVSPSGILKVVDQSGATAYQATSDSLGPQVVSETVACAITGILRNYPAQWSLAFNRPTAGKSGTTDGFVDAWYMAYTPDWVVATWTGHTEGSSQREIGMKGLYGVDMAAYLTVPFVNSLPRTSRSFSCHINSSELFGASPNYNAPSPLRRPTVPASPLASPESSPLIPNPRPASSTPSPLPIPGGSPRPASSPQPAGSSPQPGASPGGP
jgi:membrane peptidoglycan carboxypeptidase